MAATATAIPVSAIPASAIPATVTGYVEAVTETAVLGWAWVPGQAEPLEVELHLGGEAVARATANDLREDLARSGIGTGRHAFTLPVDPAHRARLGELRVVARAPGGAAVPLNAPPAETGVAERLAHLHRGVEMLVGSQRVLHRNVQAALLGRTDAEPNTEITTAQAALQTQIDSLELFVTRLDERLAALAPTPAKGAARHPWPVALAGALSVIALAVSVWGLMHSVPG